MSEHIQRIMDAALYWGDQRDVGPAAAKRAWREMILRVEAEFALLLETSRQMWDDDAGAPDFPTSNPEAPAGQQKPEDIGSVGVLTDDEKRARLLPWLKRRQDSGAMLGPWMMREVVRRCEQLEAGDQAGVVHLPMVPTSKMVVHMAMEIRGRDSEGMCRLDDAEWKRCVEVAERAYKAAIDSAPEGKP